MIFASHRQMKWEPDLTCWQASEKDTDLSDEWYNAVQVQVSLAKYPPETASILHRDVFWFYSAERWALCLQKQLMIPDIDLDNFSSKQSEAAC